MTEMARIVKAFAAPTDGVLQSSARARVAEGEGKKGYHILALSAGVLACTYRSAYVHDRDQRI